MQRGRGGRRKEALQNENLVFNQAFRSNGAYLLVMHDRQVESGRATVREGRGGNSVLSVHVLNMPPCSVTNQWAKP